MPTKRRLGDTVRSQGKGGVRGEDDESRPLPGRQRGLGMEGQKRVENGECPITKTEACASRGDVAEHRPFVNRDLARAADRVRLSADLRRRHGPPPKGRRDVQINRLAEYRAFAKSTSKRLTMCREIWSSAFAYDESGSSGRGSGGPFFFAVSSSPFSSCCGSG